MQGISRLGLVFKYGIYIALLMVSATCVCVCVYVCVCVSHRHQFKERHEKGEEVRNFTFVVSVQ